MLIEYKLNIKYQINTHRLIFRYLIYMRQQGVKECILALARAVTPEQEKPKKYILVFKKDRGSLGESLNHS